MAAFILFLAFSLFLQRALGGLVCEELPMEMCSYSISFTGTRCLLETDEDKNYQCKTSGVAVNNAMSNHIEVDECIRACGLDRNVVGISSDKMGDSRFLSNICSQDCTLNCPNIVDLYSALAMAEGGSLSEMCKKVQKSPRRMMVAKVRRSAVAVASGPAVAGAPGADVEDAMSPEASIEEEDGPVYTWAPVPAPM